MHEPAARRARRTATALAGGRRLDRCSLVLTLLALTAALAGEPTPLPPLLLLGVALGIGEKIYAVRVAFDQRVFAAWAEQWQAIEEIDIAAVLAEFDQALARLHLRSPTGQPPRRLDERIAGAGALLRQQAICLVLQCAAVLAAAFLHPSRLGLPFINGF